MCTQTGYDINILFRFVVILEIFAKLPKSELLSSLLKHFMKAVKIGKNLSCTVLELLHYIRFQNATSLHYVI